MGDEIAKRLTTLRRRLGLSQREMAAEFGVTPGALAMWEMGTRPIPGPVAKIIDIYESYLDVDTSDRHAVYVRRASSDWTSHILSLLKPGLRTDDQLKQRLEASITSTLEQTLAKDRWKCKLQLLVADKLVKSIGQTKGLPMKVAQLASYAELRLPQEVRDILAELQTMSPPMAAGVAARVFYEDFGKRPDEVFAEWNPHPFAAASIGQVHRARLKTGDLVAVKIQYPNIAEALASDFDKLEFLRRLTSLWSEKNQRVLAELRERLIGECDYRAEAEHQKFFHAYWQGHPTIRVPRVYDEFSSGKVLTQEFFEGQPLDEFVKVAGKEALDAAGSALFEFYTHGYLLAGRLHADPHPGNFLFSDGRLTVLDYGRVVPLSPSDAHVFRDLLAAIMSQDRASAQTVIERLGIIRNPAKFGFEAFWTKMLAIHHHLVIDAPCRMSLETMKANLEEMRSLAEGQSLESPASVLWSNCTHLGVWYLFGRMGATMNWRAAVQSYLERMPAKGFLSRWNA